MNRIKKNKLFIIAFFILIAFFCFGKKCNAQETNCQCLRSAEDKTLLGEDAVSIKKECMDMCIDLGAGVIVFNGQPFNYGFASGTTLAKVVEKPGEVIKSSATSAFIFILSGVLSFVTGLLSIAATIFNWAVNPDIILNTLTSPSLYTTWAIVRDFLNVSFIMFLLFSAFATVFQIEKYNYKKTLLMIVIMALLVNFSFPIARFIIDFSNMLMYYLIDSLNIGSGAISGDWLIQSARSGNLAKILSGGASETVPALISSIVFTFILAVTLLVIAILFVVRIIALSILIVFSSLAFVGAAIPPLAKYANDWWSQLFKYAFFGPIMIFMLYVAVKMMALIKVEELNLIEVSSKNSSDPNLIAAYASFVVPIVILWMGLGIAQSMSIAGAGAITGKAKGFMGWAGKTFSGYRFIKPVSKAGAKAFDRNFLARYNLSPRQFLHGWKESTREAEESKLAYGKGVWHDRLNNIFSLGKQKTNKAEQQRQALVSKKSKEVKEVSEESAYLLDRLSDLSGSKNPESIAEIKAILRTIYSNNDQDELMDYIHKSITEEPESAIAKQFIAMGFKADGSDSTVSEKNVSGAVVKILEQSLGKGRGGAAEEEINKELLDLGNIAAAKGGIGFAAVTYNPKTKKFERIVGEDKYNGLQGEQTAAKVMTMGEAQNIPKTMHRNNFTDQAGGLNDTGKALLRRYASPTAIKHIERHKPDFYKSICLDDDGVISKEMLQYASKLKSGKADGWNPDIKDKNGKKVGGYTNGTDGKGIKNEKQAVNAAAWTAALMQKSGVKTDEIRDALNKAGFNRGDINEILKLAGVKEEKGSGTGSDSGIETVNDYSGSSRGKTKFDDKGNLVS